MEILKIDKAQARAIALQAQGLDNVHFFGKGKAGALNTVKRLGYIQLDTLSVVARAHHHTLWTRSNAYVEKHLEELVKEKKVFEYWSHAAAYMPMEDFRFSLPRKETFRKGRSHWFGKDKKVMQYVLDRIKAEGPLQSRDFENDKKRASWFDWKPAKNALEQLFQDGTLMVAERRGFQKVYDLAENILPVGIDTSPPTNEEYAKHLIENTLKAHGFSSVKEMTHLRKGMGPLVQKVLNKMLKEGQLEELIIEGVKEKYFQQPKTRNPPHSGPYGETNKPDPDSYREAVLLSPFDNAVIMRNRLKNIFDFDYGIECYLPEHKRTFGYFCLPILYGDQFVGRLDPKADREKEIFIIKSLYLEHPPASMDKFIPFLANAIKRFAAFNNCKKITIEKTYPAKIKTSLKAFLR